MKLFNYSWKSSTNQNSFGQPACIKKLSTRQTNPLNADVGVLFAGMVIYQFWFHEMVWRCISRNRYGLALLRIEMKRLAVQFIETTNNILKMKQNWKKPFAVANFVV